MTKAKIIVPMRGRHVAAPPTSPPNFKYNQGPLISSAAVNTIFWGAAWQAPAQSALIPQLNQFFGSILSSSLIGVLFEYSVPSQAIEAGWGVWKSTTITDTEPGGGSGQVNDAQIQTALQDWMKKGTIAQADP